MPDPSYRSLLAPALRAHRAPAITAATAARVVGALGTAELREVSRVVRSLGWRRERRLVDGVPTVVFVRPPP